MPGKSPRASAAVQPATPEPPGEGGFNQDYVPVPRHIILISSAREMKTLGILILVLMVVAGCRPTREQFHPGRHTFVDESAGSANAVVLTSTQASHLLALIRHAIPDEVRASGRAAPNIPRPQLAPSLCVNVYDDAEKTKSLGQILGFERKWIVTAGKVISETNTVEAVYRAVGR
jgi:hypothetical protein